ncbi:MAG: metal-dependent transcriptional regulator [Planctomycetes bacterium]|nr:metal-dependent transcriptional regulator [Planctomycetota bacterium]
MGRTNLTSSLEDYLEAILGLERESGEARVSDIAAQLKVSKSAVTGALKTLSDRKMVNYDPYQHVTLTGRGRKAAAGISERHEVLRRFLTEVLGLKPGVAEANACRMEHVVDNVVLERLTDFAGFVAQWPPALQKKLNEFLTRPRGKRAKKPKRGNG